LAAVTTSSRNAASGFKLIGWLASAEISSQLARAGDGTMPVRRSQVASPDWYDQSLTPEERAALAKMLQAALGRQDALVIPRIPGVDRYMAVLDEAVADAIAGNQEPEAELREASIEWEKITDEFGRDMQRRAYLNHLGINEP
jgi:ABC-type glycerol-3-phosphate transport system substrate-binding protein